MTSTNTTHIVLSRRNSNPVIVCYAVLTTAYHMRHHYRPIISLWRHMSSQAKAPIHPKVPQRR
ncbi:unnamed protein product, partial [Oppiella nova]